MLGFFTPFDPGQFYEVSEQVTSLYAMADLDFDLGPVPVAVNGGVRYVDTSITSSGYHQIQNPNGSIVLLAVNDNWDNSSPPQEFNVELSSREFFKGEKFDVDANEKWQCEFPSRWEDKPPLKILLQVKYTVSFKPTKHF